MKNVKLLLPVLLLVTGFAKAAQGGSLADKLVKISEEKLTQGNQLYNKEGNSVNALISIKLERLEDNAGLKYVGGKVPKADLAPFLAQLRALLGKEFEAYRSEQVKRDHGEFHVTVVNPFEYKKLNSTQQLLLEQDLDYEVTLLGLGKAEKGDKKAFFIVAKSPKAQALRALLSLKEKDFHVTLGFSPTDVYGVAKNESTLIASELF